MSRIRRPAPGAGSPRLPEEREAKRPGAASPRLPEEREAKRPGPVAPLAAGPGAPSPAGPGAPSPAGPGAPSPAGPGAPSGDLGLPRPWTAGPDRPPLEPASARAPFPDAQASFTALVDDLWAHRHDLSLQPRHTAMYRLSGLELPEESPVKLMPFLRDLQDVLTELPPGIEAGTSALGATRAEVSRGLRAALAGELGPGQLSRLEWGRFRFHRRPPRAGEGGQRIYLNTQPEAALPWARALVGEVLARPERFPGVERVELSGPGGATRVDDVSVTVQGDAAREAVARWIAARAEAHPGSLERALVPGTEPLCAGVGWGELPDPARYPGESFRSVRARVLSEALGAVMDAGGDRDALDGAVADRMREAGLDPEAPHRNLASAALPEAPPAPLPGAVEPEPGVYTARVDAWGTPVEVEIEVPPAVADILRRQRRKASFLPEEGSIAFIETDRTRDPPRHVVSRAFSLTHAEDQRYKIEKGEAGPRLLAFDRARGIFYVPKRVRLVPGSGTRLFRAEPVGGPQPGAPTSEAEPLQHLVHRFVAPGRTPAQLASAASRIEGYLSDPDAKVVSSVPLEEGVNGKAIVRLDNGAVALWKPSSAEYPEPMRPHLDPDHFARREAFAYEVSKAMGHLARVPPAVYRELGGQPGALITIVRRSEAGVFSDRLEPLLAEPERPDYRALALLDHVLGSLDRHHGNVLFVGETALAIDHGMTFPRRHGEQGHHEFLFSAEHALDEDERARLDAVLAGRAELESLGRELGIHERALELLFERVGRFLADGRVSSYWREA